MMVRELLMYGCLSLFQPIVDFPIHHTIMKPTAIDGKIASPTITPSKANCDSQKAKSLDSHWQSQPLSEAAMLKQLCSNFRPATLLEGHAHSKAMRTAILQPSHQTKTHVMAEVPNGGVVDIGEKSTSVK